MRNISFMLMADTYKNTNPGGHGTQNRRTRH